MNRFFRTHGAGCQISLYCYFKEDVLYFLVTRMIENYVFAHRDFYFSKRKIRFDMSYIFAWDTPLSDPATHHRFFEVIQFLLNEVSCYLKQGVIYIYNHDEQSEQCFLIKEANKYLIDTTKTLDCWRSAGKVFPKEREKVFCCSLAYRKPKYFIGYHLKSGWYDANNQKKTVQVDFWRPIPPLPGYAPTDLKDVYFN